MSFLNKIFGGEIKKTDDPFLRRLSSSVVGGNMLTDGNIILMEQAIKNMPLNSSVFEIGCYGGNSSVALLHMIKKYQPSAELYACDRWVYEGFKDHTGVIEDHYDGDPALKREAFMQYVKNNYKEAVNLFHPTKLPYTMHLDSNAFFEELAGKKEITDIFGRKIDFPKIGFAYIDGDHSYAQCKADFINVDNYLLPGGFILFDDSGEDTTFGSALFMKETMRNSNYQFIDKRPNFLFKKRA